MNTYLLQIMIWKYFKNCCCHQSIECWRLFRWKLKSCLHESVESFLDSVMKQTLFVWHRLRSTDADGKKSGKAWFVLCRTILLLRHIPRTNSDYLANHFFLFVYVEFLKFPGFFVLCKLLFDYYSCYFVSRFLIFFSDAVSANSVIFMMHLHSSSFPIYDSMIHWSYQWVKSRFWAI